jgi:cytochrome P450
MFSDLVQASVDGSSLSDEELVAILLTLAGGGINTTKCLLGNLLVRLTSRPDADRT